jgi:hypothetical protein
LRVGIPRRLPLLESLNQFLNQTSFDALSFLREFFLRYSYSRWWLRCCARFKLAQFLREKTQ